MLKWFKRRRKGPESYQSNDEWVEGLRKPVNEKAVEQLRVVLIRGLKPALQKYVDRELHQFVEDVAQDALLKILDNVESFRGESKFTTWALKIAVREGLSELRRKRYQNISINDLKDPGNEEGEIRSELFAGSDPSPEQSVHENLMVAKVMELIEQELTDKQRLAIKALMVHGIPINVVAEKMGTNRNALYKLVHDARMKMKNRLEAEGINFDEMLNNM
ncbi:MAG: RNA polymerase sigma factor [Balneolaceae bacterium]